MVRVRADQAAAAQGAAGDRHARLRRVLRLRLDVRALIRHTVRKGSVVIYPRWQTGIATPCPGPVRHRAVHRPRRSTASAAPSPTCARARSDGCSRDVKRTSYFGFSFGGIVTANLANRYRSLHLPKPRAIFLDDPHDGALDRVRRAGAGRLPVGHPVDREAAVPRPRRGRVLRAESRRTGRKLQRGLPDARDTSRSATRTSCSPTPTTTAHPTLAAIHGVCAAGPTRSRRSARPTPTTGTSAGRSGTRLRSCAYRGKDCRYALGNTRQHRSNGRWSDGVPVKPLKIQDAAPIRP